MSARTRIAVAAGLAIALLGGGLLAYFSLDSRAARKTASKGPGAIPVSVSAAVQQSVPVRLQAIGNVEAFSTVAVKARVDGEIVAVNFRQGEEVRRGELLFRIDPRPYEAALENARLNREYCTIASPIDGYAGKVLLQVGNLVKANDANPLVVINRVRPIYVSFAVPEQQLAQVRASMTAAPLEVTVSASDAGHARLAAGRLVFIDNSVDPSTGTIKLRAEFDNRDLALWPGQFVAASLKLYDQEDAILVPSAAVQTGPQGEYVFVLKPDLTAEVRKVAVARTEGERVVIGKGLAAGEKVVTRGQLRIAPGAKLAPRPDAS